MRLKSWLRWYNLYNKKKLNLKTLNETTDKFEELLKKYCEKEPEVQELYDYLKPLFQQIRNGEITQPKDDDYLADTTYWLRESPLIAQFSDLTAAYREFSKDLTGDRENPLYAEDGPISYLFIDDDKERMKQIKERMRRDFSEADRKEREERKQK